MIAVGKWLPVAVLILLMAVVQYLGPEVTRYQTNRIVEGEWWRLLSGHWVHANWMHYVLNMAGLLLCVALTDIRWSLWQWGWRLLMLATGISLCFLVFHPDIGWYVGFSGVLFGLYVLAACTTLVKQPLISSLLLVFIALKIILEQWSSVKMTSSELIGVPVLVDAHLYGVLIALLLVIILSIFNKIQTQNINTGNS